MKASHFFLLLCACALNLLPLYLVQVGGDLAFHLARIHCHAMQFWHGDLLPRWCFGGDGGVGSPALLFYPPLPYFITALIFPLRWLSVSVYGVYVLAATLATLLAAFGAYRWLKGLVGPEGGLVGAMMYIFLPYRQAVLLGTSLYGELWVLAFAPFMASAARGIAYREPKAVRNFALWTACALLSEPAGAFCVLLGIGICMLAQGTFERWWRFALSCLCAVLLSSFYVLPVLNYMPFAGIGFLPHESFSFASQFINPVEDVKNGRGLYVLGLVASVSGFLWLAWRVWRHYSLISRLPARTEAKAWIVAALLSLVLMFEVSAPLWSVLNSIAPVGFPWRMQSVLMMACAVLAAVYARWFTRSRLRTVKGDFATLLLFLFCFEMVMVVVVPPKDADSFKTLVASGVTNLPEFRTRWTPEEAYKDQDAILARHAKPLSPTEIVSGSALVNVLQWSWKGLVLQVDAMGEAPAAVRLHQRYFPIWQARADDDAKVELKPEAGTGYMVLHVPPGAHLIYIVPESHWDSMLGRGAKAEYIKEKMHDSGVFPWNFVQGPGCSLMLQCRIMLL